jgi:hypothetical protein
MAIWALMVSSKYIVTYRIFIVTARSGKIKKRTVRHESSPSRKNVLVQELVRTVHVIRNWQQTRRLLS